MRSGRLVAERREIEREGQSMDGSEPEIPPYFLCPISLQIMEDPVTLSTGVTYDRRSIERWLASYNHNTCPVTNQPLPDQTLTPNSTLLRLIRSWTASASTSSSEAARPPDHIDVSALLKELVEEMNEPVNKLQVIKSLAKIKGLVVQDNEHYYKTRMEEAGITSLVASLATRPRREENSSALVTPSAVTDEATTLLCLLSPSRPLLKKLAEAKNGELLGSLSTVMQKGSYRARTHATLLLKSAFKAVDDAYKADPPPNLFDAVVETLKDQNSDRATTMAALGILLEVLFHGRNRVRAVEAGAVVMLVELLVEGRDDDRRRVEAMLSSLCLLCGKAEGRSALLEHPAGVAAVVAKVLRVSHAATERAVKVLLLLCKFCGGNGRVVEEMVVVGGVAKLYMLLQVECSGNAKEMAKEILGLHLRAWRRLPCFPSDFLP